MSAFMLRSVAYRSPAEQPRASNQPAELDFTEPNSQSLEFPNGANTGNVLWTFQRSRVAANCERLLFADADLR